MAVCKTEKIYIWRDSPLAPKRIQSPVCRGGIVCSAIQRLACRSPLTLLWFVWWYLAQVNLRGIWSLERRLSTSRGKRLWDSVYVCMIRFWVSIDWYCEIDCRWGFAISVSWTVSVVRLLRWRHVVEVRIIILNLILRDVRMKISLLYSSCLYCLYAAAAS